MFCKSIVLLACLVGSVLSGETVPLLKFFGVNSIQKPFFERMSQDEFAKNMAPEIENSMILCFLAPDLSHASFSCSKSDNQGSCYSNLEGVVPKAYFQVEDPTIALTKIALDVKEAYVNDKGDLDREVLWKAGRVLFIYLNHFIEHASPFISQNEVLGLHDLFISKISKEFALMGKITTIYTATPSTENISKSRRRRATEDTYTWFHSGKDFLISFAELATKVPKTDKPQEYDISKIKIDKMELPEKNDTAFTVNLIGTSDKGSIKLSFLISLSLGYFKMSKLTLNDKAYYVPSEINAPTDFSYSCGNQTFASVNDSSKILMWNSLQMQAPFNNATEDNFKFGDPWYCVGFFSSGILAGLFVVFILLGIMSVGICWMLDINTMDRFDDPKGKTITINVNE